MKITIDNSLVNASLSSEKHLERTPDKNTSMGRSSFSVLSSNDDMKSYSGGKKSVNELREELSNIDVETNQDYMAVMSGCMSDEDFGRLIKEGGRPESFEIKDTVTVMDRIKLAVAKSGKEVEGFTDTLDSEEIEAITGQADIIDVEELTGVSSMQEAADEYDITLDKEMCEEIKKAFEEISDVTTVTDGMKKALVKEDAPLTIENLYYAKHTSTVETKNQGSTYFSIETPGYFAKRGDETKGTVLVDEVKDLFTKLDIENTDENIEAGLWLIDESIPVSKETVEKTVEVSKLSLPLDEKQFSRAVAIAISEGKKPVKADVTKKENIYEEAVRVTYELDEIMSRPEIKATRIMEETRLKMTTEANLLLLESDYQIDIKDLESYVEALKKLEETPEYKEALELNKTLDTIEAVKSMPVAVIAPIAPVISTITLEEVVSKAEPVKARFEEANEKYEQVATEVRKDLGDSIKKAFRNVPEILNELGFEDTKENERAVRILGYNNLPITKENVDEIREADKKLTMVINRITPKDTLSLIREGRSPIQMSIDELNEYLDSKKDVEAEEIEKYSKFLYKLEKNNEISPEERKDFIEVYRFFHQIEKTEAAAVGSVLNQGMDLTIKNLKSAMRTAKHRGMDVTVSDVYEVLVSSDENDIYEKAWRAEKYAQYRDALKAPEEIVTELTLSNVSISAENLEATLLLRKKRGEAFKSATDSLDEKVKEHVLSTDESMDDKETALEAYEAAIDELKEAVYEECMSKEEYVDVRALQLVHRQLNVARSLANAENYEVPMEIGGQVTSVNVKLVHNSEEDPNVVISFETEELGRVTARLSKEGEDINGYISCNLKESVSKMQEVADKLSTKVKAVWSEKTDTDLTISRIALKDNTETSETELYTIAKSFLTSLKG